jgi:hypothetical protein
MRRGSDSDGVLTAELLALRSFIYNYLGEMHDVVARTTQAGH